MMSGQMPNSPTAGCQFVLVQKSVKVTSGNWKKSSASRPSTTTMPMVVAMEIAAHTKRTILMNVSIGRARFVRSPFGCGSARLAMGLLAEER